MSITSKSTARSLTNITFFKGVLVTGGALAVKAVSCVFPGFIILSETDVTYFKTLTVVL